MAAEPEARSTAISWWRLKRQNPQDNFAEPVRRLIERY